MAALSADGVRCDWLDTSHAFHSALLDPILDRVRRRMPISSTSVRRNGSLVCNRTGAALGRNVKLDAPLLASARAPTGGIRQECAHPRRP